MKVLRLLAVGALLLTISAGDRSRAVFPGQKDGPVKEQPAYDATLLMARPLSGSDYSEAWFHEMHFEDKTAIIVWVSVNNKEAFVATTMALPGKPAFVDLTTIPRKELALADQGFDMRLAQNRFHLLAPKHYRVYLGQKRVRGTIDFEPLAPGWSFGQGRLTWPPGKYSSTHFFPLPWARVEAKLQVDGAERNLVGYGQLNHDILNFPALKSPATWRAFWIYGPEFGLNIVDYDTHKDFGNLLVQRLVYCEPGRVAFTSTAYDLTWSEMTRAPDVPFFYPRKFQVLARGEGMTIKADIAFETLVFKADLFSNLPEWSRQAVAAITPNGWSYDFWCNYQLEVIGPQGTKKWNGRGFGRWTGLEKR